MKKQKLLVILPLLMILQGCSLKSQNKTFKEYVDKNYISTSGSERSYLKDKIEEKIQKKKYIDLSIKKNISALLKELGEMNGKVYLFKGDDIDVSSCTNSNSLEIDSFEKLNQYIQDTTNFTMIITKNRFIKNRVKIVQLKDLKSLESDLSRIPFYINGSSVVADALTELAKVSKFSIVFKNDNSSGKSNTKQGDMSNSSGDNSSSKLQNIFANEYITYSGDNISDFLMMLSNSFNLYVNIDYKNKLIVFSKSKEKVFHIYVNHIAMSGSLTGTKEISSEGSSGSSDLPISSEININLLDDLEKSLKQVLSKDASKNSILSFNKTSGQIYVRTDSRTMASITNIINDFNSIFDKQIDFELDIYEFAVTKEFKGGISVGTELSHIDDKVIAASGKTNSLVNDLFKFAKNTANGNKYTGALNLNNRMVQLIQNANHGYIIKNNMPYMIDLTNSKSYVKTITTTSNTSNGVISQTTTPETDVISEGTVLTVLPRIIGKRVELNIEPNMITINKITKETYDGNTISLPDISTNKFKSNITLQSGEKRVIGYITQYQDISDYNGIVPLNHFIIGGENGKKYIRKEIVFVVGVKIKD